MTAAGMVTTDTMTSTTMMASNRDVNMNPLAPSTPVKVATVGISTSTTMLTVKDHDRARTIRIAPASTTGSEHANARPMISHRSSAGIRRLAPHVTAAPHRLHPMLVAELGAQSFHVHGHGRQIAEVPLPHLFQKFLSAEHDAAMGEEEQQQIELAVGQIDGPAVDGHRPCGRRHRQPVVGKHDLH